MLMWTVDKKFASWCLSLFIIANACAGQSYTITIYNLYSYTIYRGGVLEDVFGLEDTF